MIKRLNLKRDDCCAVCSTGVSAGTTAWWDTGEKQVLCVQCHEPTDQSSVASERGVAGASARRIADRQTARQLAEKAERDAATRAALPRVGNAVVKVRDVLAAPPEPTSWQKGVVGEERVGTRLEELEREGFAVIHDRRKPRSTANIDHIVVGPRGVYVIDAKRYRGTLEIRRTGSLFRRGPNRLFVNGRNRDKAVTGMEWQIETVRAVVGDLVDDLGGVFKAALCMVDVRVELGQQPDLVGENDVLVTWPKRLVKDIGRDGPLSADDIQRIADEICRVLPAA